MWNPDKMTKHDFRITYQVTKSNEQTFPLPIINKICKLMEAMRECGIVPDSYMMVCGNKISFTGASEQVLKPTNDPDPWKNIVTFRAYEDKMVVICAMCLVILLGLENFYYSISTSQDALVDGSENNELWTTAWSIILHMQGGEYEKVPNDKEVE